MSTRTGPTYLDALSLLSEVADELVVRSVRDTHDAWADRFGGYPGRTIASAVCAGLGLGLRAASAGFGRLADTGVGPRLEDTPRGRFVSSAWAIGSRTQRRGSFDVESTAPSTLLP